MFKKIILIAAIILMSESLFAQAFDYSSGRRKGVYTKGDTSATVVYIFNPDGSYLPIRIPSAVLRTDSTVIAPHTSATRVELSLTSGAAAGLTTDTILGLEVYVPPGSSGFWGYDSAGCVIPLNPGMFAMINIDDPNKIYFRGTGTINCIKKK